MTHHYVQAGAVVFLLCMAVLGWALCAFDSFDDGDDGPGPQA